MSKRVSLRQFQQDLSARLQNAASQTTLATSLAVRVGSENWLIDLAHISEVIAPMPWVKVPMAQPWFMGVSNIRGKLYSVVNLPGFIGQPALVPDADSRLLLVHDSFSINAALLVNQTLGLRSIENKQQATISNAPWISGTHADVHAASWQILDMRALVTHPAFLQAGL
jgi:Chemotaxis signal transduction protein